MALKYEPYQPSNTGGLMNGKTSRLLRRNSVYKKTWNSLSHKRKSLFRQNILNLGIGEKLWRKSTQESL